MQSNRTQSSPGILGKSGQKDVGQSLAEFALLLPVILLILVGVVDLGRVYLETVTLSNAAREGARQGARNFYILADIRTAVIREATNSGITLVSGDITVTCGASGALGAGGTDPLCPLYTPLRVTACHDFQLILRFFYANPIRICRYAEMMVP